jgi:hypothetical protein
MAKHRAMHGSGKPFRDRAGCQGAWGATRGYPAGVSYQGATTEAITWRMDPNSTLHEEDFSTTARAPNCLTCTGTQSLVQPLTVLRLAALK